MPNKNCQRQNRELLKLTKLVSWLALGLTVSACSAPIENVECCVEEAGGILLEARGNEPFWNLTVFETRVEMNRLSEEQLRFAWQQKAVNDYQLFASGISGAAGSATFTNEICNDSMTGMPYPKTVVVTLGEDTYYGCAGDSRELLTVGEWQITHIKGNSIAANVDVTINFGADGEAYGNSGCNRFVGHYSHTGENFQLNQLASTRMACPSIQMDTESAVLESLGDVVLFDIQEDGALHLITHSGEYLRAILK
ncbi:heat shock protein [Idiomarina sp. A28L]|uniref:META domain-containing protein n=1 Tax=Idiomarina sp. A28L TaxID=1036674 RepID=UPI0002138C2D|nr:META domain-containing protein [Idiomarina sp. A28L]EGN75431.1 heat shock protein [Idiomarina sp. A28L]